MIQSPFFKSNIWVLLIYLHFLVGGVLSLIILGDVSAFDYFHNMGKPFFNSFFSDLTKFAEGPVVLALILILALYKNYKTALALLAGLLVAVAFTQILKLTVFSDWHRPVIVLWESPVLNPPEFVTLKSGNSFPSGHTTAAFAVYGVLSLFAFRNQFVKLIFIVTAILVGYSRVFLGQHFVEDILLGSCIGLAVGGIVFYYISGYLGRFDKLNHSFVS